MSVLSRRDLRLALGLALALRAGVALLGLAQPQRFFTLDAEQYVLLARDLRGGYLEPGHSLLAAGLMRTPGYPVFAAFLLALGNGSVVAVVVAQIVLGVLVVALAFVLARSLFGPAAASFAAFVLAADPASVVYCCLLQPETLFTLLVVAAAVAWRSTLEGSVRSAASAGTLLGLATLTRPIAVFLPLVLAASPWLRSEWSRARRLAVVAALLAPALLLCGGWILHNWLLAKAPVLSTIEGTNLLYYRAAGALAEERGLAIEDARRELQAEMSARVPEGATPAERSRAEASRALEILREHPVGAATSAARGAAKLLAGTGMTALSGLRGDAEPEGVVGPFEHALAVALAALLALLYLGAAQGAARLLQRGEHASLVFLGLFALYFVLISAGPEANTRFRVPVAPFLAALAGAGFARWTGSPSTTPATASSKP